jgi:cytoskeletal protein RodZ
MDEEIESSALESVGQRLRAAREEKGYSLEDVASETRIPLRHLESLEASDWERLPAPTYTIGFAKSYASAVGLDRSDIGEQLRGEIGGSRSESSAIESYEPADPTRAMPRWLVIAAIAAIVVAVLFFTWIRNRSLSEEQTQPPAVATEAPAPQQRATPPAAPQPNARGPVVLTATAPAWVRVSDQGKTLFEGMMQPGQAYQVPQTAAAPELRAGAPEALRITVGQAVAPAVGPAGQVVDHVSLRPADLMNASRAAGPSAPATAPTPNPPPSPAQNSLAQ